MKEMVTAQGILTGANRCYPQLHRAIGGHLYCTIGNFRAVLIVHRGSGEKFWRAETVVPPAVVHKVQAIRRVGREAYTVGREVITFECDGDGFILGPGAGWKQCNKRYQKSS